MTSVPALTTTFTPASSCLADIYYWHNSNSVYCLLGTSTYLCQYYQLGPTTSTSNCFPSGWNSASTAYFSPGICPSGYRQACSSTVNIGSLVETRATCCPSGYDCQTSTNWPWYSTDICSYGNSNTATFAVTTTDSSGHYVTSTTTDIEGFNAYGVSIRYQATDFASTRSTSSLASPTSSSQSTSTSATATSNPSSSSGLSTGAKAGIGVGCAVGFILLVLVGLLVFRWRSRARSGSPGQYAHAPQTYPVDEQFGKTEMDARQQSRSELHGGDLQNAIELPAQHTWVPPAELSDSNERR